MFLLSYEFDPTDLSCQRAWISEALAPHQTGFSISGGQTQADTDSCRRSLSSFIAGISLSSLFLVSCCLCSFLVRLAVFLILFGNFTHNIRKLCGHSSLVLTMCAPAVTMWSVRFKNSGIFLKYRQIYLEVIGLGSAFISTLQSRIAALNVSVRGSQQLHNGRVDYNINPPRTLCSLMDPLHPPFSHFSSSLIPLLVVETHTRTHTHAHTQEEG